MESSHVNKLECSIWSVAGNRLAIVLGHRPADSLTLASRTYLAKCCCEPAPNYGVDNVLYIDPLLAKHDRPQLQISILEPDGSLATMCGNGVGCAVAQYAANSERDELTTSVIVSSAETNPGKYRVSVRREGAEKWKFNIDLGRAQNGYQVFLDTIQVPSANIVDLSLMINTGLPRTRAFFTVLGEPHLVVVCMDAFSPEVLSCYPTPRDTWLPAQVAMFPFNTNVLYASMPEHDRVYYRAFERNRRETAACGTGAGAIYSVLTKLQLWPPDRSLRLCGTQGTRIAANEVSHYAWSVDGRVFLEAEAVLIATHQLESLE